MMVCNVIQIIFLKGGGQLHKTVTQCSSCYSRNLDGLYSFGEVPLAGYFPIAGSEHEANKLPMDLLLCKKCGLVQVSPKVEDKYLFSNYRYRSVFSMSNHFKELSQWIKARGVPITSRILEIGSNDGTLLQQLIEIGFSPIGVDPAQNIVEHSIEQGHKVLIGHFSEELVADHGIENSFDLAISCNSFAHIERIREVARGVYGALKVGGRFLIEVQSWEELVRLHAFDFVYHEHKYYYDKDSMCYLLALEGFKLESAELVSIHGGSWRFVFIKVESVPNTKGLPENSYSLTHQRAVGNEIEKFFDSITVLERQVKQIVSNGGKIVGFGASGRANMLLNYLKVSSEIPFVFDESPERIGRNMGFTGIQVLPFEDLRENEYTHCVVFAWNFFESVSNKWPHKNKFLICPLPDLKIIRT